MNLKNSEPACSECAGRARRGAWERVKTVEKQSAKYLVLIAASIRVIGAFLWFSEILRFCDMFEVCAGSRRTSRAIDLRAITHWPTPFETMCRAVLVRDHYGSGRTLGAFVPHTQLNLAKLIAHRDLMLRAVNPRLCRRQIVISLHGSRFH